MLVELAVDDLLRRRDDGLAELCVKPTERHIGFGSGALDDTQSADDRLGLLLPADLEIPQAALGLRTPVAINRHLDAAKAIGLGAGLRRTGLHGGHVICAAKRARKAPLP